MPLEYIRGSEDPDSALFRQMEQYVLDHYPNPTRTGCPDSQTLKLLVYEAADARLPRCEIPACHGMCRVYARSHCIPQDPHGRNRRGNSCGVGYTKFINSDLCVFIPAPAENASQIRRTRVERDSCGMYCRGSCDWHASQAAYNPRSGSPF